MTKNNYRAWIVKTKKMLSTSKLNDAAKGLIKAASFHVRVDELLYLDLQLIVPYDPNVIYMQALGIKDDTRWDELTDRQKMIFFESLPTSTLADIDCKTFDSVKHLWQGFEVYEGDVLRLWRSKGENGRRRCEYAYPLVVEYHTPSCQFAVEDKQNKIILNLYDDFEVFKVIGNIYENPELGGSHNA